MKTKMLKVFALVVVVLFVFVLTAFAGGGLDDFLRDVNAKAKADLKAFTEHLSATFKLPVPQVDTLIKKVEQPANAYMVLQVGTVAKQPTERVLQEYEAHKGKGWGVIAKNLGIKPGSPEFHALKRGEFASSSAVDPVPGKGKGKGHGKKGHD